MSFFDNSKNVGLALIIVGLINLVAGIGRMVVGVTDESVITLAAICFGIASLIFGILILGYGFKVRNGPNDQSVVVSGLIRTIGIATILQALFIALGAYFAADDSGIADAVIVAIGSMIVSIIIGLILIWAAGKVAGANKNVISKLLWVILIVIFLILAVLQFISIFAQDFGTLWGILGLVAAICMCIVYIYCFIAMLSEDVKKAMGI